MTGNSSILPTEIIEDISSTELLKEAFEKFNAASLKLQERYDDLSEETVILREKLALKEKEVQRAERLATLGKTAAALAHEIRNPLGAITLYTSILKEEMTAEDHIREILDQMEKSASVLNHVVTNILQFCKTECPPKTPVNLSALFGEIIEQYRLQHPELEIRAEQLSDPFILGNEHGLRQVFQNLISNSVQAMKGKGSISIFFASKDKGIEVSLEDSGPGISSEILTKVFDPFVTTRVEGTGLGLAVVEQIVSQHGGTVSASNTKQGACFQIWLPGK